MNTWTRILIVGALAMAVAGVVALKRSERPTAPAPVPGADARADATAAKSLAKTSMPRLVDLGAGKCIPCKLMAPILDELRKDYASHFEVHFIDVWENPEVGKQYGVEMIPTQIFYDAGGRELYRHTGFFGKEDILSKWKELGVDTGTSTATAGIVREEPVQADTRPRGKVCSLCDGDITARQLTRVKGTREERLLCSPHCYFIYLSSLVGADPKAEEAKVEVTDSETGTLIPAVGATYLYGLDAEGRATILAFARSESAKAVQGGTPGTLIPWDVLRTKELATRCGFCDRAVYPEDACPVTVAGGIRTQGCCTHCALGVAARLQKDIEVEARDGLSGELVRVKTLDGKVAALQPASAIAWFGQKKSPDGQWASAGCFKQGFFVTRANLEAWLEQRPAMTGRQITIAQALADKMKLDPEQIAKACKLGECK